MYPRPFEYARPETVEEAIEMIGVVDREARPIAGGQSLVPMLSLGLAAPDLLVDLAELPLGGFERVNGTVRVGALTRHRELERSAELAGLLPLASEAAHHIGNPRVRNRGTLGGSLSHADPAAELGAVALTYGGKIVVQGPGGERTIAIDEFFHGFFATAIEPGELLTRIDLDLPAGRSGHGFSEIANRADDFATAAATVLVTVDDQGVCSGARLAVVGVADRPLRLESVEELCRGKMLEGEALGEIAAMVTSNVQPESDAFVSGAYRARVAGTCATRALETAWRRARGE